MATFNFWQASFKKTLETMILIQTQYFVGSKYGSYVSLMTVLGPLAGAPLTERERERVWNSK